MNLFIYSDESGVFDKKHNELYVYGGVIFFGIKERDEAVRLYLHAEKTIRKNCEKFRDEKVEIKASALSTKQKYNLYRSFSKGVQFAIAIEQEKVLDQIFNSKKDKQRFLDYAYKVGLKKILNQVLKDKGIKTESIENMYFYVDEHNTATNGKYELRESLEQEYKLGTYNTNYSCYFPPIFPNLKLVDVKFCNSGTVTLVRMADIIANRSYGLILGGKEEILKKNTYLHFLP